MEYLGTLIKSTRQKKQLSLDEVYRYTKIPKEILLNIEADRISTLNPTYLKGYLKIYAKFLGLEVAAILKAYKNILPGEEKPILVPARSKNAQETINLLQFNPAFILNIIVVFILLFSSFIFVKHMMKKRIKITTPAVKTLSKKAAPLAKKDRVTKQARKPPIQSPERLESIKLAIQAKENTYLQVSVDGSTMFRQVLRKGQTESWVAKDKIELTIANAAGVELELNGKILPPLGRRNQPIKNILINRDGLHSD